MSLTPVLRSAGRKSHPQLEAEDSTRSTDLQGPCGGPFLIRTYVRFSGLAPAEPLERSARCVVDSVGERRASWLGMPGRLELAQERLRGTCLHQAARRCPDGRVA